MTKQTIEVDGLPEGWEVTNVEIDRELQWHWMMEWCKRNMLHPGESWVWAAAEKAYKEHS